jgi:hypothetical protein
MAILTTSIGICTIKSPFKLNMITIVKSKAIRVMEEIIGTKTLLNHSFPFNLISAYFVLALC